MIACTSLFFRRSHLSLQSPPLPLHHHRQLFLKPCPERRLKFLLFFADLEGRQFTEDRKTHITTDEELQWSKKEIVQLLHRLPQLFLLLQKKGWWIVKKGNKKLKTRLTSIYRVSVGQSVTRRFDVEKKKKVKSHKNMYVRALYVYVCSCASVTGDSKKEGSARKDLSQGWDEGEKKWMKRQCFDGFFSSYKN